MRGGWGACSTRQHTQPQPPLSPHTGYINYIYFYECSLPNLGARVGTMMLFVIWLLFLLHLVETTTTDYFCASLQLAVDILKLSPNVRWMGGVRAGTHARAWPTRAHARLTPPTPISLLPSPPQVAGVTFLAVGNAACDVIASVAAFATGVPKVGVGTTLGACIFVTCAVVAAVTFVADVRLARRSFTRDLLFFIGTVVYLLFTTLDGVITLAESIGEEGGGARHCARGGAACGRALVQAAPL